VRNTFAVHDADLNTFQGLQRATQLEPDDARNWYQLGRYWQYNLDDPDAQRAIFAYQTALSFDPHSADAWLDLATAQESEGNIAAARDAFFQAKRAYPMSPDVSWRYGNFLLRRGELDPAFGEIRHAVEVDPKRAAAAFALCIRVSPDLNAVLDRAIPPSQDAYLTVINGLSESQRTDQALVVWSRLAALHPKFPLPEAYPLIEALLRKLQVPEAQRVWNDALAFAGISRPADPPGSLVWDGGFETNAMNGGFGWRYAAIMQSVQIALDSREKHSGKQSLRLTFSGLRNVDFNDVCQFIAVQPSTSYRFSAWVHTQSLSTDQGIRFGLFSVGESGSSTAWTEDVRETQPWMQIALPWVSGRDVRELKLCISRNPSAKFDSKIHGFAWIDDVLLVPDSPEHAGQ
jgi:tetratricopeptide (TPR) repeat protein